MKRLSLLVLIFADSFFLTASNRVFINVFNCESQLTLYENGRADWYDCELSETYYGHYWQQDDTLFVETFCSNQCYEDHVCFMPRVECYTQNNDTLIHWGFKEYIARDKCYSDNVTMFDFPFIYIAK